MLSGISTSGIPEYGYSSTPGIALDHYVKDVRGIHGYGRYMDDGYAISNSLEELRDIDRCLHKMAEEMGIIKAAVFLCSDSSHGGIKGGCRHAAPDTIPA